MRTIDADALLTAYDAKHKGPPGNARRLIETAPTIDAIPVEWIKALTNHSDMFTRGAAKWVLGCWKKEQEAQDGNL